MLKIIVCDDDERDLDRMTELVEAYRSTHQEQPFSVDRVDTASELVLNSLFCQDAVFAHCSFLLWFYTNGWARLCMARPWPPRGSGTGSCTLPPYGLWNHAAVPGGVRSSLIRLLLFALWNVVEGWRAAALSPFWEGAVFEQSRYCSIRSVLRHRCWEIFEPYCRPGPL